MSCRNFLFSIAFCLSMTSSLPILESTAFAVVVERGFHTYYTSNEIDLMKLDYLIDPTEAVLFDSEFNPYPEASQVLFLGDGFERKYTSLCEKVQQWAPKSATLYRTDITFPESRQNDNVIYQRVDHQRYFPFSDNQFTTIVMRYGLCHCQNSDFSCAGIKNMSQKMEFFLSEVSRVLEKNNSDSIAYLHGNYFRFSAQEMSEFYKKWEQASATVGESYPNLKIRLVHRLKSCDKCVKNLLESGTQPEGMESEFLGVSVSLHRP